MKSSRRKIVIPPIVISVIAFIISFIGINIYIHYRIIPKQTYYIDTLDSTFPIMYQLRGEKKVNELRGYSSDDYRIVANKYLMVLNNDRKLNLLINNNGSKFDYIEYEIRDKNSNSLIERTKLDVFDSNYDKERDETRVTLSIQNLISPDTSYLLTMKIDTGLKKAFYFTNIESKKKTNIDEALNQVETFTKSTFDEKAAAKLVKYLETSINRDTKEMHTVTLQQTFEQITFANTGMKLMSDLYYQVYQAQEYSFNIVVNYLSKSDDKQKNELFINKDEYVLRWDGTRWYYMKFKRNTEELINLDDNPYDNEKQRFYTGVTNPSKITKIESENKEYFAFTKQKELYRYDARNQVMTCIFSYRIKDKNTYERISDDYDIKILDIDNNGNIRYIVYGYNMAGNNEGSLGIGIYTYNDETDESEENLFIPIYTTFQSLKYDLGKLCVLKNNRLIFKSYSKVYSVDIYTSEIFVLAEDFEETKFAASENSQYFAFNNDKEGKSKAINIYNIDDGKVTTIFAKNKENIEVITFMNDDLFYGVFSEENLWREIGKIIGRPSHEIRVKNVVSGEEESFTEKDMYFYNFVNEKNVLRFNKYTREDTHYTYQTNDVIVNNYYEEIDETYSFAEELTKEKLRIGYFNIETNKKAKIKYKTNSGISRKQIEDTPLESQADKEEVLYYVYDSGNLITKLKNLTDGINEIRDDYGYVKLNDKTTCYNRSNKGNVSYLRQGNSILENIEGFEENIYLKENKVLVMNVTGVTERDLEYYISLNEKVAVFKYNMFQFFITGYDNNNYVLEYENKDRILTPRDEVQEAVRNGGYVIFAQLENLE